jgi:hypothetical protein
MHRYWRKALLFAFAVGCFGCKSFKFQPPKHRVVIDRSYSTGFERELIRRAERMTVRRQDLPEFMIDDYGDDIVDRWWTIEFTGLRIPYTINEEVLSYYRQLNREYAGGNFHRTGGLRITDSMLDYRSGVLFHDQLEIAEQHFVSVFVVTQTFRWYQYCGPACSLTIDRERQVVFSKEGNVLEVLETAELFGPDSIWYLVSKNSNQSDESIPTSGTIA